MLLTHRNNTQHNATNNNDAPKKDTQHDATQNKNNQPN